LKEVREEICEPFTVIGLLQRSIDEGSVPDDWRNANISPSMGISLKELGGQMSKCKSVIAENV